jgi:NAD(P)-dependent dehydrogenase (short-subunit alcohol dehydrogenase family)
MSNACIGMRLAIVTGATGGMGAATAIRLTAEGWSMILCDLDAVRLDVLAATLRAPGLVTDVLEGSIAMGSAEQIMTVNYDATARLVALAAADVAGKLCRADRILFGLLDHATGHFGGDRCESRRRGRCVAAAVCQGFVRVCVLDFQEGCAAPGRAAGNAVRRTGCAHHVDFSRPDRYAHGPRESEGTSPNGQDAQAHAARPLWYVRRNCQGRAVSLLARRFLSVGIGY